MNRRQVAINGLLAVLILSTSLISKAGEVVDYTIHQEYLSVRALGMGNAFTAIADDHSAMFYNPAALARRKDGVVHTFIKGGLDMGYLDLFNDIDSAQGGAGGISDMFDLIEKNYGEQYNLRLSLGGMWVRPNWGVAIIPADISFDVGMHQQVGPQLNANLRQDTTIAYSYARNANWFGEDHELSWGVTAKIINRLHYSDAISAGDLAMDVEVFDKKRATEGMTLDADVGLLYTPSVSEDGFFKWFKYAKPTFAAVIRNLGDYGYPVQLNLFAEDAEEPPKLQRRLDLGSSWDLPNFWVFDPHLQVDVRDIFHENWQILKGLHIGAEFFWTMASWWKGHWSVGLNQGYLSAGIGAKLALFQLDIATWGEEISTSNARKESRRVMLEMSLDF